MEIYDFVVLGGGSAGYAAARTAAAEGLRTAVVEGGAELGGLCILRGCMPSKTLIESANRYSTLRRAEEFGLRAGEIGFDTSAVIARKRRLIGEFASYRAEQLTDGSFDLLRGLASFVSPREICVANDRGETRIGARTALIATGSRIAVPDVPGLAASGCLTSDDLLERETLPRSVIVLGAGPVGLEMAHYLNAFGVDTTVIQRSARILKGVDPDVALALEDAMRRQGVKIFKDTQIVAIESEPDRKRVTFSHEGEQRVVESDEILNALGRTPNIGGLGLEDIGVTLNRAHVLVSSTQETAVKGVFAAGDVCGPLEVVHLAIQQGEIAARNAARFLGAKMDHFEEMDYRLKLFATFTEPQVAVCGLTEAEAAELDLSVRTATYAFGEHGKSMVMGETDGFVKLMVSAETREILGAACVGPHASDLLHEVVVAMHFHATAGDLARVPHYHPTLAEIWTYPAEELA